MQEHRPGLICLQYPFIDLLSSSLRHLSLLFYFLVDHLLSPLGDLSLLLFLLLLGLGLSLNPCFLISLLLGLLCILLFLHKHLPQLRILGVLRFLSHLSLCSLDDLLEGSEFPIEIIGDHLDHHFLILNLPHFFLKCGDFLLNVLALLGHFLAFFFNGLDFLEDLLASFLLSFGLVGYFFDQGWVLLDELNNSHGVFVTLFHFLDLSASLDNFLLPLVHFFVGLLDFLCQSGMLRSVSGFLVLDFCKFGLFLVHHL